MEITSLGFKAFFICFDIVLYLTIVVPLFLSLFGKLNFELGHFNCDDSSIKLEKRPSSVGKVPLLLFYFLLPFLLIFLVETFLTAKSRGKSVKLKFISAFKKVYHIFVRYFIWATLNILLNDILKVVVAMPRPHFVESCQPDWDNINCSLNSGRVKFARSLCLSDNTEKVFDAMKSWPSGHAQLVMFAAVFILAYLEWRVSEVHTVMLKRWLQALVLVFPLYSSASRVHDQKHHVSDVVWGGVIGAVFALLFCWNLKLSHLHLVQHSQTEISKETKQSTNNPRQKRPSRMQLIQSEFGTIEEMESEMVNHRSKSHNNHVFHHTNE